MKYKTIAHYLCVLSMIYGHTALQSSYYYDIPCIKTCITGCVKFLTWIIMDGEVDDQDISPGDRISYTSYINLQSSSLQNFIKRAQSFTYEKVSQQCLKEICQSQHLYIASCRENIVGALLYKPLNSRKVWIEDLFYQNKDNQLNVKLIEYALQQFRLKKFTTASVSIDQGSQNRKITELFTTQGFVQNQTRGYWFEYDLTRCSKTTSRSE